MLKPFITVLLTLGIYVISFAQTKGTTEFGVNVGINGSNYEKSANNNYTNNDYRIGFNVGISADYYFSDRWSVKAKLIYDQKGWNNGLVVISNNIYATDYKLNYLTIPVMANWHFGKTRN